ncbi:MAG: RNA methyltransferase [Lewinellaceae bacterium]|nr:RNA methyltransferase [Lewinellaceae bacterium]
MSLSRNQIKAITALQIKKFRSQYKQFIAEGDKIVQEVLAQTHFPVLGVYALEDWVTRNEALLATRPALTVEIISPKDLERISGLRTPNQVLALLEQRDFGLEETTLTNDLALYLDGIQDPGNLGAILRVADWFGIQDVCCSPDCVDLYNPKVIQASMGAFLRVRVPVVSLDSIARQFSGIPIIGTTLEGNPLPHATVPQAGVLVIGNEGAGIRPEYASLLTGELSIPRAPGGGAESLNAAVATGIFCAYWRMGQTNA